MVITSLHFGRVVAHETLAHMVDLDAATYLLFISYVACDTVECHLFAFNSQPARHSTEDRNYFLIERNPYSWSDEPYPTMNVN